MQIITFASRKGGAGKTTLARQLAIEAQRQGVARVGLIDFDTMRGLTLWWEAREATTPERIDVAPNGLEVALPQLVTQGFNLVLIDTPPAASDDVSEAIGVADLIVVPVRPSPDDLRAVGETIGLVEAAKKPMVFVINAATRKALLTAEAARTLSQHGTVAEPTIHRAEAFPQSAIHGLAVAEFDPSCSSAREIEALWSYVAERVRRISGVTLGKPAMRASDKVSNKRAIRAGS